MQKFGPIVLLLAWLAISTSAQGFSTQLLQFASVMNGVYSNRDEVGEDIKHGLKKHDQLEVIFRPIETSATSPEMTFYFEESVNNKLFRMQILVVTIDEANIIHMKHHNFTNVKKYKPGSFDVDTLKDLKPEDLHTKPECESVMIQTEPNVFIEDFVDCDYYVSPGQPGKYIVVWTCDAVSGVVFGPSFEMDSVIAYELHQEGDSFPLPSYMLEGSEDFVDPCAS